MGLLQTVLGRCSGQQPVSVKVLTFVSLGGGPSYATTSSLVLAGPQDAGLVKSALRRSLPLILARTVPFKRKVTFLSATE